VAAGDCAGEDGRPHLERRAARLASALEAVDLFLAPSQPAADVLEANGVPRDRLRVDENGMALPDAAPMAAGPAEGSNRPVMLRYTGGSNEMKGAQVLLDAVHELGRVPDIRVLAHG